MIESLIEVKTFAKPISDCNHSFIYDIEHNYVDLDRVANKCMSIIYEQLPKVSNERDRIPPLVLLRFARGGKTKTLTRVFDDLKKDGRVLPIFISFNGGGSTKFRLRDGETHGQAILRLIAVQLNEYLPEEQINLLVDRKALDRHIGDNVVLLIDELNHLSPIDNDAAELLRDMFLDRSGRFLVFTSHFPVYIDTNVVSANNYMGTVDKIPASFRVALFVNMSLGSDLNELRGMSTDCEALTEEKAAWLGYIPSLIYVCMSATKFGEGISPSNRFRQMNITVAPDLMCDVLMRFVNELLTGHRDPVVAQYYSTFASVGADSLISYPLCYVKEIFSQLQVNQGVRVLLEILNKLEVHLDVKHSGIAWECIVQVAIVLRMLNAESTGDISYFGFASGGSRPTLAFRTLPDGCDTVEKAKIYMDDFISEFQSPALIYVASANALFPQVEGFLVYTIGSPSRAIKLGFQMKTSDVKPTEDMDTNLINGGAVLIRGQSRARNPRPPRAGWRYMTSKEVRSFLGYSLLSAIPRNYL